MDKKFYSRNKKYVILYPIACVKQYKYESSGVIYEREQKETL